MPGVGVTFGAKDTGLDAMHKKIAASAGKLTEEYRRGARELKSAEKAGVRSFARVETAAEKYRRELRNINAALRANLITQQQANRAITGAQQRMRGQSAIASSIASSARGYLSTWVSVQAVISLVTREMAEQAAIFDKTATDQDRMADAVRRLMANLGTTVPIEKQVGFVQQLVALGQERGVSIRPSILVGEASRMVSATTGGFDSRSDIVLRTIRQVAPMFISRPEEMGRFGGGFQAFLTTMQTEGIKLKDSESFGLFLQAQSQVRAEDIKNLVNIIPGLRAAEVAAQTGRGGVPSGRAFSLQEAKTLIAAFAVISSRAEDPSLEKTRTAIIKMIKVLEERFPDLTLNQQFTATAGLRPAQQLEMFKSLSALRSIGPIIQQFLRDPEKKQFREIMSELVIDADSANKQREAMLSGMNVLVQSQATKQAEAIAEVRRIDEMGTAAGARARISEMIESEVGFGFRTLARLATNIDLGILGRDPRAVEQGTAELAFNFRREQLEALPEGQRLSGDLRRLSEALERLERIYGSISPPLNPETKGE